MIKKMQWVAIVALAVALTGCKKSHESVMKDMLSEMKDAVSVLKGVKDKSSAEAANSKLKKIGENLKKIGEQAKGMKDPSPEEQKRLMEKYMGDLMKVGMELNSEQMRIAANPELAAAMKDGLQAIGSSMRDVK